VAELLDCFRSSTNGTGATGSPAFEKLRPLSEADFPICPTDPHCVREPPGVTAHGREPRRGNLDDETDRFCVIAMTRGLCWLPAQCFCRFRCWRPGSWCCWCWYRRQCGWSYSPPRPIARAGGGLWSSAAWGAHDGPRPDARSSPNTAALADHYAVARRGNDNPNTATAAPAVAMTMAMPVLPTMHRFNQVNGFDPGAEPGRSGVREGFGLNGTKH